MGLLICVSGLISVFISLAGYLVPAIREAEDRLPDQQAVIHPAV